jgi:ribosome-associated toxin RatA of RatAB toxin-antitoxin module
VSRIALHPIVLVTLMPVVEKSVLVTFPAQAMFELVDDVLSYPRFLPWCSRVELLEQSTTVTRARIHMAYMGIRTSFATRNVKDYPQQMQIALEEGPFRTLSGFWNFQAIESLGSRVRLALQYEFENVVLAGAIGPVFDRVAASLVDSFVEEAERRDRSSG